MASSGGVAGVAADAAEGTAIELPELEALATWVHERVPGEGSVNPLDLTGFVMRDRDLLLELFTGYANADGVDALVLCWWAAEGDEAWSRLLLEPFAEVARSARIPLVVSPVEATAIGGWTRALHDDGLAFCRGLRSTYRALEAVDQVAGADAPAPTPTEASAAATASPPSLIETSAGPIVPFGDAMGLLREAGVPVAPFVLLPAGVDTDPALTGLGDQLVVKLADVPHRTELGAVRVGVTPDDLPSVLGDLRDIARAHGLPEAVAVQQMVAGSGEAFVGLQGHTDLGAILLFGLGGVFVELTDQVDGVRLPLRPGAAPRLVESVAGEAAFARLRGRRPWAPQPLIGAIEAVAALWEQSGGWLDSADLNPLIVTDTGVVAVDALLVANRDAST
jgi:acyl-CoA synthetase (NDP forming)